MSERDQPLIPLGEIVEQFATAMHAADKRGPRAVNPGSKHAYQPGIGPHPEHQAVDLVMRELALQTTPMALARASLRSDHQSAVRLASWTSARMGH
jgi:hypothetical protein